MAVTFNSILADPEQNSLISVAQADDIALQRLSSGVWDGLSTGDKQKCLMEATAMLEEVIWEGVRVNPTQQGLQWPRQQEDARDLRFEIQGVRSFDINRGLLDKTVLRNLTIEAPVSETVFRISSISDQRLLYPDDHFNHGSVRVLDVSAGNKEAYRTITDFSVSSGDFVCDAFAGTLTAGDVVDIYEALPIQIQKVCFQLAATIAREGDGYAERAKKEDPERVLTRLVDRLAFGARRRVHDIV